MTIIDGLILAAFLIYTLFAGFINRKKASQSLEEYFLAGRSLKGWQAGISMAATQFSADTPLLVTGLIATAGIFSLWQLWIYALAFLLMGFLLAPSWHKAKVITDAELAELRYGGKPALLLRTMKALYFGTFFNCTVLAMVLLAASRICEPFLLWNQWLPPSLYDPILHTIEHVGIPFSLSINSPQLLWVLSTNNLISIILIALLTMFYSTSGGLRSVVATDILQFALMMIATTCYAVVIINRVDGWDNLPQLLDTVLAQSDSIQMTSKQLLAFTPDHASQIPMTLVAVFALQWIAQINADGSGYLAQRSMACRSDKDAKQAAVVFTVAQILLRSLLWIIIGLGLLVLIPPEAGLSSELIKADREMTFVTGMSQFLPIGLKGLMLTAMLAALASTVDTHLNWGASYWSNDLYKRLICQGWLKKTPSEKELVWVARFSNLCIFALSLFIMAHLQSIQEAWQASLMLGAGIGVMLVLRWLWWRINAWGEITCIALSFILVPVLMWAIPSGQEALRLLLMMVLATIGGITVSCLTPPESEKQLAAFYQRTQPPGFWGEIEKSSVHVPNHAKQKLMIKGSAVIVAAFSIFCLLTGIGSWIAHSPPPVWFPWSTLWIGILCLLGLGLIPLWVKLAFQEKFST